MMQLLCDGVALDLYENAQLQFTHKNPLFAFDNLECERTTEFKLPSTPVNDRVLALARIPAYKGVGMRRKFTAQLQAGTVVRDGYLYISEYDGKDYKGVFVCGELVELQRIKNLGKLADIITFTKTTTLGGTAVRPSDATGQIWANVKYLHHTDVPLLPSIELNALYTAICTQYNIVAPALPVGAAGVRIVPDEIKGADQLMEFKCEIVDTDQPYSPAPETNYNTLTFDGTLFDYEDAEYGVARLRAGGTTPNMWYLVRQFKAKTNLVLQIPDDWPDDAYIIDLSDTHVDPTSNTPFYGGRWFSKSVNQSGVTPQGTPLAGRSVAIRAGECFSFVCSDSFAYNRESVMGTTYYDYGFQLELDTEFAATHNIVVKTDPEQGDLVRLQDNLPDITFTELLKTIAALSGRVLNYSTAEGITFESLDYSEYAIKDDFMLTKRGSVARTFADYGRNNLVQFDDENADKLVTDYTIDNDNLEYEKELQTIPFSEGKNVDGFLYVDRDAERSLLGIDKGGEYLSRVGLPKNAGLQALCDASTQFKVECRMLMLEYDKITAKMLLQVDGTRYVWTERSWQGDVAKFTLAKIA